MKNKNIIFNGIDFGQEMTKRGFCREEGLRLMKVWKNNMLKCHEKKRLEEIFKQIFTSNKVSKIHSDITAHEMVYNPELVSKIGRQLRNKENK